MNINDHLKERINKLDTKIVEMRSLALIKISIILIFNIVMIIFRLVSSQITSDILFMNAYGFLLMCIYVPISEFRRLKKTRILNREIELLEDLAEHEDVKEALLNFDQPNYVEEFEESIKEDGPTMSVEDLKHLRDLYADGELDAYLNQRGYSEEVQIGIMRVVKELRRTY